LFTVNVHGEQRQAPNRPEIELNKMIEFLAGPCKRTQREIRGEKRHVLFTVNIESRQQLAARNDNPAIRSKPTGSEHADRPVASVTD